MGYFKYRGNTIKEENGSYRDIQTLLNDSLYASSFHDLNDPFEATYNDFINYTLKFINKLTGVSTDLVVERWEHLRNFVDKLGVYSLAQDSGMPENELMWSFYANSHKGFCVEYDVDRLIMSEPIPQNVDVVPVSYGKRPPSVTIGDINSREKLIAKMFSSKSKKWEYEKEVRLVYNSIGIKKYYPQALKAVYFGLAMPEEFHEQIIDGLKGKDVLFYQMERVPGTYNLRASYLCCNTRGIPDLFRQEDYELLSYDKNAVVENFHVYLKLKVYSEETLTSFVQWYRKKYAVKDKSNVYLYDSPLVKPLIDKYPLDGKDLEFMKVHNIAVSDFCRPNEVFMFPLKDDQNDK